VLGHRRILQGHHLIHYSHEQLLILVFPKFPHFLGFFDFPEIGVKPLIFLGAFTCNGLHMMDGG
jgi:hypothetical protein